VRLVLACAWWRLGWQGWHGCGQSSGVGRIMHLPQTHAGMSVHASLLSPGRHASLHMAPEHACSARPCSRRASITSHKLVSFASTSTSVTVRSGPHTANTYCCESSVTDICHRSVSTPSHPQLTQTAQGRHAASVLEGRKHHHRVVAAKAERVGDAGGDLVRLLHVGHGVDVRHLVHQVVLRARGMLIRSNQNRWCCAVVAAMVHQAVLRARGMLENQTFIPGAALGWQSCLLLDHQPFCVQNGMHVSAGDDGSSARACTRYG